VVAVVCVIRCTLAFGYIVGDACSAWLAVYKTSLRMYLP
jgi:hypothetical protein